MEYDKDMIEENLDILESRRDTTQTEIRRLTEEQSRINNLLRNTKEYLKEINFRIEKIHRHLNKDDKRKQEKLDLMYDFHRVTKTLVPAEMYDYIWSKVKGAKPMKVEVVYETPQPIKEVKLTLSEREARIVLALVGRVGFGGCSYDANADIVDLYSSLRDALKLTNEDVIKATSTAVIYVENKDFFK